MAGSSSAMALIAASRWDSRAPAPASGPGGPRALHTATYEDNFNFGFSVYQPMIDYLDKKLSSMTTSDPGAARTNGDEELPHLPFSDEIGLLDNRPVRRVNSYSKRELESFVKAADEDNWQRQDGLARRATCTPSTRHLRRWNINPLSGSSSCGDLNTQKYTGFRVDGRAKLTSGSKSPGSGLSSQYSMSKESIKQAVMSTSPTINALREKSREIASQNLTRAKMYSSPTSSDQSGVRKSRSFGAFTATEKSVSDFDFDTKMTYNKPVAVQASASAYSINKSLSSVVAARKVHFEGSASSLPAKSVWSSPFSDIQRRQRVASLESRGVGVVTPSDLAETEALREQW